MPNVYFTAPDGPMFAKTREIVQHACHKLGLEISPEMAKNTAPTGKTEAGKTETVAAAAPAPVSKQNALENSVFVIADITCDKDSLASVFRVVYDIGYARRAQKSVIFVTSSTTTLKPQIGQEGVLVYAPDNLDGFRSKLLEVLLALCHKEKIRYNRLPDLPQVKEGEKLPLLAKQDLRTENYVALADAFVDAGRYEQAHEAYSKAILHVGKTELLPGHAHIFFKRGFTAKKLERLEEALGDYSQAIELSPQYVDAYIARGLLFYDVKKYKEALADFEVACKLRPDFTRIYVYAGSMYRLTGEYERAIEQFNKAVQLNPGYAEAFYNRGLVYVDMKKPELAIQDFSKATTLNNQYFEAFLKRGLVYMTQKNYDLAIQDFNKVVELKPDHADAYDYRGQALFEKGFHTFHERAIQDWQKALELGVATASKVEEKIKIASRAL